VTLASLWSSMTASTRSCEMSGAAAKVPSPWRDSDFERDVGEGVAGFAKGGQTLTQIVGDVLDTGDGGILHFGDLTEQAFLEVFHPRMRLVANDRGKGRSSPDRCHRLVAEIGRLRCRLLFHPLGRESGLLRAFFALVQRIELGHGWFSSAQACPVVAPTASPFPNFHRAIGPEPAGDRSGLPPQGGRPPLCPRRAHPIAARHGPPRGRVADWLQVRHARALSQSRRSSGGGKEVLPALGWARRGHSGGRPPAAGSPRSVTRRLWADGSVEIGEGACRGGDDGARLGGGEPSMSQFDALNKAKKAAEQAALAAKGMKEQAAAKATDFRDQAVQRSGRLRPLPRSFATRRILVVEDFKERLLGKVAEVKDAAIAGIKDVATILSQASARPFAKPATPSPTSRSKSESSPKVKATFAAAPDISQERVDAVIELHKDARVTVALLKALYGAYKLQRSIRIAGNVTPRHRARARSHARCDRPIRLKASFFWRALAMGVR